MQTQNYKAKVHIIISFPQTITTNNGGWSPLQYYAARQPDVVLYCAGGV